MRNIFSEELYKIGKKNKKIHIVAADISPAGSMEQFRAEYPSRFINVGVAEQVMIGVCAGLAMRGQKPFAYTIATFVLYRPFEMIRDDLGYQNLPVTVVGMGAGTVYSNLGGTHLAQEDVSIAKSIPNMRVIAPSDPLELKEAVRFCAKNTSGPIYLRIGKSGEKNYTKDACEKWKFGKIRKINNGQKICFLTYGPIIKMAYEVIINLKKKKFNPSLYSCHTLKPFDSRGMKKIFKKYDIIVVIEDHSEINGLAADVKISAYNNKFNGKILSYSLKDQFFHTYEKHQDMLDLHGINKEKIIKDIIKKV
jgi:transketolase